ncbi:MAG: hypothetical protein OXE76_03895 [Alphaproteobacteria bacterium]|nr:hypothetical protein [Alphaproteobacteria bacterium]
MRTPKFTPGPWRVSLSDECAVVDRDGCDIADCGALYESEPEQCEANARLIAASPDMLEALKAIIDNRWLTRRVQESINKAERAIEKAEPK